MPPIRVECTTPGLEENWLDVSDFWTRAELQEYGELSGDPFVDLWRKKVVACHIETGDVAINDPAKVHDQIDQLDIRLIKFLTSGPRTVTDYLLSLGEANKRLSLPGTGEVATTKRMVPAA